MLLRRRDDLALLRTSRVSAAFTRDALGAPPPAGPPLWLARRAATKVYIFGSGAAKDRTWLTPDVENAFHESQQVWFETPHPNPSASDLPPPSEILDIFKRDAQRSLFDVLPAGLSARLLAAARKYDVAREILEYERPWYAFFVLNRGYWAYRASCGLGELDEAPDNVLAAMARKGNKQVLVEFPTYDALSPDFMPMSGQVECEWLEFLLDYLDEEEPVRLSHSFGWITGRTSTRILARMRARQPALYEYEVRRRNKTWALRIDNLLSSGGVYFVALGMNHVLGPDSILKYLKERGVALESLWQERALSAV